MPDAIEPFHLAVPQAELDDLRERLSRARWPDRETVDDTSRGPPLAKVRALCDRWRDGYDRRRCEALLDGGAVAEEPKLHFGRTDGGRCRTAPDHPPPYTQGGITLWTGRSWYLPKRPLAGWIGTS